MAWFNKANKGETPTPVTSERLQQAFRNNEWAFDLDEENANGALLSGFDNRFSVIRIIEESDMLVVATYSSGALLPGERLGEAIQWANHWNKETTFGTAHPSVDDENDLLMKVDASFPVGHGATDEQLDMYLKVALSSNLQAITKYIADLDVPDTSQN